MRGSDPVVVGKPLLKDWFQQYRHGTSLAVVCGLFTEVISGGQTEITCGRRDHDTEFIRSLLANGELSRRSQIFQSELAALSWNLLMILVNTSCNTTDDDKLTDPSGLPWPLLSVWR